jgi:hypothetical protein
MSEFMAVGVGDKVIAEIGAIVRSYPEGISVEKIVQNFGFTNRDTIRAALQVLTDREEVVREGEVYRSSIYSYK